MRDLLLRHTDSLAMVMGSGVAVLGLSRPAASGILVPGQGSSKPVSPALQGRFLIAGPPGKSLKEYIF